MAYFRNDKLIYTAKDRKIQKARNLNAAYYETRARRHYTQKDRKALLLHVIRQRSPYLDDAIAHYLDDAIAHKQQTLLSLRAALYATLRAIHKHNFIPYTLNGYDVHSNRITATRLPFPDLSPATVRRMICEVQYELLRLLMARYNLISQPSRAYSYDNAGYHLYR